jgi:hypothetical protein
MMRSPRFAASASTAVAIALFGGVSPLLAQRIDQLRGHPPIVGISCDEMEGQRVHIHQHLSIYDRGKPVPIPSDVGRPASGECLYWLHTHTPDGVIHIESPANRTFTLGDFFAVWGQPLDTRHAATAFANSGTTLKVWLDGKPYPGNPANIPLVAHADIVIEVGPPFPKPEKFTAWGQR